MGMTIQRMIELLEVEHECMLRQSHGGCDRRCADCDLVQEDGELHEMYTDVIAMLKAQEPKTCNECKHYDAKAFSNLGGRCRNSRSCHYCYGCDELFSCNAWEGR